MKNRKHWGLIGVVVLLALSCLLLPIKGKDSKVIRVAYPIMDGLSMKDGDGNYYGYDYDYLMQIAQYTGWEYEFVEVEGDMNQRITTLMNMLKDGEIDLMGDTKYIESLLKDYDYASEPYGSAYNIIAVKNDSSIIDYTTLANKKNLRIAMIKSAGVREEKLKQYAQSNDITYERIVCDSTTDMLQAVEDGLADAILSVDLSIPKGYYSVARFSPDPFYFVTTKGNSEIITELNQALTSIAQSNPTLSSTLYQQYFSGNDIKFVLNENETDYVKAHPVLKVLSRDGNAPIQYVHNGELKGIGKDILNEISKKTGIRFEYYIAESYEEYKRMIKEESIDILMGLNYESNLAERFDVNLSNPYVVSDLVLATNGDISPNELEGKRQGITYYSDERFDINNNYQSYEGIEDILLALQKGNVDYAYMSNYQLTYYINKYHLKNVTTYPVADYLRSQYAFGIVRTNDLSLLSLMNKAIRSLGDETNTYIYNNAYVETGFDVYAFIEEHAISLSLFVTGSLLVIFLLIRNYYHRQLRMKKAVELEYQRYQLLSDITGEMTFSYDYAADELKISPSGVMKLATQAQLSDFSTIALQGFQIGLLRDLLEKEDLNKEAELTLLDGEKKWYAITLKVISNKERNHETAIYAIGKVVDIQKEKQEKVQLIKKSRSDALTGILNRAGGKEFIQQALAVESRGALLMLDLDYFKDVNDQYGHVCGDEVLVETAAMLMRIFQGNIIARLGGDEFLLYIHEADLEKLTQLCDQAIRDIGELPCMLDKDLNITMSMGVVYTKQGDDLTALIASADQALYEVKRNGKNGFSMVLV